MTCQRAFRHLPSMSDPTEKITHGPYLVPALILIAVTLLIHGYLAAHLELVGDEAYYWLWSRHMAIAYYSKPPGVALAIAAGTSLFGNTAFGVRFTALLFSLICSLGFFFHGRSLYNERVGFFALIVSICTPIFVAGSLLMTIDIISVTGWLAACWIIWTYRESRHPLPWLLAGFAVFVGTIAKLTTLAILPSLLLFACLSPTARHWLRWQVWVVILGGLAGLFPTLYWNSTHHWITFRHLFEKGGLNESFSFTPLNVLHFLGTQAAVAYPPFFAAMMAALVHRRFRREQPESWRYLATLFLPLFALYGLLSFQSKVAENWLAPSYVAGVLLAAAFGEWQSRRSRLFGRLAIASLGLAAAIVLTFYALFLWVPIPHRGDLFERARGSRQLADAVVAAQQESGATLLIAHHYMTASLLSFYMPGHPTTFTIPAPRPRNQFDIWPGIPDSQHGATALYISRSTQIPDWIHAAFESVGDPEPRQTTFRGKPEKCYYLTLCQGYRGS